MALPKLPKLDFFEEKKKEEAITSPAYAEKREQVYQRMPWIKPEKPKFLEPTEDVRARDILREIPLASKEMAKEIGQTIARSFFATSASIYEKDIEAEFKPETNFQKKLTGTDKPISFRSIGEEVLTILKPLKIDVKYQEKIAIPVGIFFAGLDIIPFGVGKKGIIKSTAKQIAKLDKTDDAIKALKPVIRGTDEEIKGLAEGLVKLDDKKKIEKIITKVGEKKAVIPKKETKLTPKTDGDVDMEFVKILRGTKGMTADDIMKQHPNIQLKKDVPAKDIYGNKVEIDKGEKLTPYELKGNKILLQDGETYIVSKNQFQNIKGHSKVAEGKPFAPELEGLEVTTREAKKPVPNFATYGKEKGLTRKQIDSYFGTDNPIYQEWKKLNKGQTKNLPKYSQYQLPDGKDYKEILIQAPVKKTFKFTTKEDKYGIKIFIDGKETDYEILRNSDGTFTPAKQGAPWREYYPTKSEALKEIKKEYGGDELVRDSQIFKSPHWDEPNVISQLRMNDRTYKGKKVSFMEELQSDWANEIRKKGTSEDLAKEGIPFGGIPTHPLVKGNKWQESTIKRALKEAVENDADYFAWISGAQTSARYNLATHVENIKWKSNNIISSSGKKANKTIDIVPKSNVGVFSIDINNAGKIVGGKTDWNGKKLDEVLGKGLADKIMEKESGKLSGEGLEFGGEWAKNLYDKQVPNIVKDLTGAKVIKMDMGLPIKEASKDVFFWAKPSRPELDNKTFNKLKVGDEMVRGEKVSRAAVDVNEDDRYIITEIIGDGKFKAVLENKYNMPLSTRLSSRLREEGFETLGDLPKKRREKFIKDQIEGFTQTFDISQKTTTQQGIKLTPEIKAKIKGEALEIKTSGKKFEEIKAQPTDISNKTQKVAPMEIQSKKDDILKIKIERMKKEKEMRKKLEEDLRTKGLVKDFKTIFIPKNK